MSYSDLQLKNATQVAYKDFQFPFNELVDAGKKPPFTIEELCNQMNVGINDLFPDLDNQDISKWKIVDYYDTNKGTAHDTGFYGCVIDVGNGDAIIAFRGSEGATDLSHLKNDWIEADLGLLNNTLTIQQGEAYKFLQQISESDYIREYDSLAMTGHSLGGNLAEHAAIISADPKINLEQKLVKCVNFDGPGYSDEYIGENKELIEIVRDKIVHYQWSPVGGLLFSIPENERIPLEFYEKNDFLYNLITRHSTESIIFDGENAKRGETTTWDILTSNFSQGLDHMPRIVGDALVGTVSTLLYTGIWMSQKMISDGKLTPFGNAIVVAATTFVIAYGPIKTVALVGNILFVAVVSFLATIAYEIAYEIIENIVNIVVERITDFCKWLRDKVQDLKEFVVEGLNYIKSWLESNFNSGYRYADSNPQIKLDTYKLRNYAQRLQSVNRRINNLDARLDDLYWKVGLLDLWDLMSADLMTGYSWRLTRCSGYLNDTASDFDAIETRLVNSLL